MPLAAILAETPPPVAGKESVASPLVATTEAGFQAGNGLARAAERVAFVSQTLPFLF